MRGSYANSIVCIAALLMTGCSDGPDKAPSIGDAYVGPMTLNIRQDISLKSPVVATVKHGDELEVLSVRRRFMRVRSAAGAEGWVDSEKLLTTEQMGRLRAVAEVAAKLPVQAEATVYDARNVHTEPHRQSPSFAQLKEEEKFLVLGHKLVERGAYSSEVTKQIEKASAPPPRKKKAEKTARNKSKSLRSMAEINASSAVRNRWVCWITSWRLALKMSRQTSGSLAAMREKSRNPGPAIGR